MFAAKHPVLIYAEGGIGDNLLAYPALKALEESFPDCVSFVCQPGIGPVLASGLRLRGVHELAVRRTSLQADATTPEVLAQNNYHFEVAERVSFDAETLAQRIGRCDLLVSLNVWHSQSMEELLRLLKPSLSIGAASAFDVALPTTYHVRPHAAECHFAAVRQVGISRRPDDFELPPFISQCREKAGGLGLIPPHMKAVALHMDTAAFRMWPIERWNALLRRFLERHQDFVAVVVGIQRLDLNCGPYQHRILWGTGLDLETSFGLVALCDLFVGIDSCMLHLADLSRIPGVGLFGPSDCAVWGFRFSKHRHVSGCGTMDAITVDSAKEAMESLLSA